MGASNGGRQQLALSTWQLANVQKRPSADWVRRADFYNIFANDFRHVSVSASKLLKDRSHDRKIYQAWGFVRYFTCVFLHTRLGSRCQRSQFAVRSGLPAHV